MSNPEFRCDSVTACPNNDEGCDPDMKCNKCGYFQVVIKEGPDKNKCGDNPNIVNALYVFIGFLVLFIIFMFVIFLITLVS